MTQSNSILFQLAGWPLRRWPWATMALVAALLEACALYFQHGMGLQPCEMCIYERIAMLGLIAAGLIGITAPHLLPVRLSAFALWLASSLSGLKLAWDHYQLQINPPLFATCASSPDFPTWLPLNQWLPAVFESYGLCEEDVWHFAGLSMVEWLIVIFAVSTATCLLFAVLQLRQRR